MSEALETSNSVHTMREAEPASVDSTARPSSALTPEDLRLAYLAGCESRTLDQVLVRLINQGRVRFSIWGPGEELHGTATALAFHKVLGGAERFGFAAHYRSGALLNAWYRLNGSDQFSKNLLRQQLSKATDPMSRGRQMPYHVVDPEFGLLPVQSPVGMQLGKAAGYAKGFHARGIDNAVVLAAVGDGSTAEGDLHDAMNAASVWKLPLVIMVTDNKVAISTTPDEGRGILDFEAYAEAFGFTFVRSDGRDFQDCYDGAHRAATVASEQQTPVLWHVTDLPRLNGHSSAGNYRYDLERPDPLQEFGAHLVDDGVLAPEDIYRRTDGSGADFFNHHELGTVMGECLERLTRWLAEVEDEPEPTAESIFDFIRPPIAAVRDPDDLLTRDQTHVTYAGALRAAHRWVLEHPRSMMWGQDVGHLGGVMQATAGLKARFGSRVLDAPLNEPLIVGTATGAALHPDTTVIAEIQFGDYSLNTYHWLVYLGNLYWQTAGVSRSGVIVRMPTDPFGGGAIYHSMSVDGFFTPIPGLIIVMPSTSYDAYGLLVSAAEYNSPVIFLEPKWCYRRTLGPALPGEPTDPEEIKRMKAAVLHGEVPEFEHFQVQLGKAALRRKPADPDLTLVAWGRAVHRSLDAAAKLAAEGIEVEVLDLRTLVPPDMEAVMTSVDRSGRLLVAAEDRIFAGFGREIQGAVVSQRPGTPTDVVGMKPVPGIAQNHDLEHATTLDISDIVDASRRLVRTQVQGRTTVAWLPPPYLLG
jgi:2-oxoisovalerate dehydrogenase E1 component